MAKNNGVIVMERGGWRSAKQPKKCGGDSGGQLGGIGGIWRNQRKRLAMKAWQCHQRRK